ncbi:MAG: ABC transporter permease [Bacteroidia bacterium]
MNLPLYIALRYFVTKRKGMGFNASGIISFISLGGFFVGTAALIIILSVFNGFERMFTGMFTTFDTDLKIIPISGKYFNIKNFPIQHINANTQIASYTFTAEENALLHYSNKQTIATIKGVDENYLSTINLQEEQILEGEMLLQSGDTNFALVGSELSFQLGVDPYDQFNILGIYVPKPGKVDILNPQEAFSRAFINTAGIFNIQDEIDGKYVIIPLRLFEKLLQKNNKAGAIEIKLVDTKKSDLVQKELQEKLGDKYKVINRYQMHESFYKVMKSEKAISYIILVFILLVAAFNTIGSLYMLVIEKKQDLKILNALGLKPKQALAIYLYQGLFVALAGGVSGLITGIMVCILQEQFGFIKLNPGDGFFATPYPVGLRMVDILLVLITIVVLGFITAIYPAFKSYSFSKNFIQQ